MALYSGNMNVEDISLRGTFEEDFADKELVTITTREFNRRMKSHMLIDQEKAKLRSKRRCLKNRGYSKKARKSKEIEEESLMVDIESIDKEISRHEKLEVLQEEHKRLLMEIKRLQEKLKEDTNEAQQYAKCRNIKELI